MRLKKGSKVEVLYVKGVPAGSWLPAEIVGGNGRYYSVQFDRELVDTGVVAVRVPRKIIRPRPPLVRQFRNWELGEVVEIFDCGTWKPAEVLKLAGKDDFWVCLLGCLETFKVCGSNLRVRQVWQDEKWRVVGKELGVEQILNGQGPDFCKQIMKGVSKGMPDSSFGEKRVRGIDRPSSKAYHNVNKKCRREGKDDMLWRVADGNLTSLPEKVVATFYPEKKLGGKYMLSNVSRHSVMESDKGNSRTDFVCSSWRGLETDKDDYDDLSMCSSSGSNNMNPLHLYSSSCPCLNLDSQSDDAHSCTGPTIERRTLHLVPEDVAAEIHKIELHAYRSTLEALYASGPMSWEQEALISNLRSMLHISNDEHLLELRHLTSRESIPVSH